MSHSPVNGLCDLSITAGVSTGGLLVSADLYDIHYHCNCYRFCKGKTDLLR